MSTLSLEPPRSVSVHWDLENIAVPRGASPIQVVNRIREAVMGKTCEINAFYAYLDVSKASLKLRQELAMAGLDLIDCSSASGKPGQVDLRIIARALRTSPTEGVVIISGDSDFAYVISSLRSARRQTVLVYDANNTAAVSTALLEVANVTIGVPFSGEAAGADDPEAAADDRASVDCLEPPDTSSAPMSLSAEGCLLQDDPAAQMALLGVQPESMQAAPAAAPQLNLSQRQFLEAVARSPEASGGGWRMGTSVGEIYSRLSNGDSGYRAAKKALIQSGRVQLDPTGRDLVRLLPA